MNIVRNVTMPVMFALIFISLLIATLTFLTAESEFHQFDHLGHKMPILADAFRSVYAVAWLLPVIAGGITIWLLRQPEPTAGQFVWSAATVTVLIAAWAAFAFVALYTLHVASHYYL
jgi:hypothetical protein